MTTLNPTDDRPLFSIVIATYNYGHLIERAIDSALKQTYQDFELIVVDDGSSDDTRERLERYGDRVRYFFQENNGQSAACNRGADLAQGAYICILDADDEYLPDALEKFAATIAQHDLIDTPALIYGGYISISEDGKAHSKPAANPVGSTEALFAQFLRKRLRGVQNCSTAVSKHVFARVRFPETLRRNTDIVFYAQVVALFPAFTVSGFVAKIHSHPQRTRKNTKQLRAMGLQPVEVLFGSEALPKACQKYKGMFKGQRLRSLARSCYTEKDYREARSLYWRAFRAYPPVILDGGSLKRWLLATIRSLL